MAQGYTIRLIEATDNKIVEHIIRSCLIEYGANHEGTAWADVNLGRFSEIYVSDDERYWVAEDECGVVVGGVGIGRLPGSDDICELQKMYLLPEARGTGIADKLMLTALMHAKKYYKKCYLETLPNMLRAQRFYEKHGFTKIDTPPVTTEHFMCDVRLIRDL